MIQGGCTTDIKDVVTTGIQKATEYLAEHHLMPGEKDRYIASLEADLEKKEKEIASLKRSYRRRNWRQYSAK